MFKVIKADEQMTVNNVTVLIYGEAGAGKTSLASTSNNNLLLDFDKGAHRSAFRKDTFAVTDWGQIESNYNEFLKFIKNYDTIIIDTADSMLEFMGAYANEKNPKLRYNKLQWYGAIKDLFLNFVNTMKTQNKDIIFIAHVKEKDEGDIRIKRPAIMGGSYDKVLQTADFVGFVSYKDNKRTLDFTPSEYHVGKNSAKFELITIPDFAIDTNFFATKLSEMKQSLSAMTETQKQALNFMNDITLQISEAENLGVLNDIIAYTSNQSNVIKIQVFKLLEQKATELNGVWDGKKKLFLKGE